VLGIFAHPDDEAISCGGMLALHSRGGNEVHCRFLTNGVGARDGIVMRRLEEMNASCKVLGVQSVCVADFPDQHLASTPEIEINRVIEGWLDSIEPAILLSHSVHDLNSDHRAVARSILVAIRIRAGVRSVGACEGEWPYRFNPDMHQKIDPTMHVKLAAVGCYESEKREAPHPRSVWGVLARAGYRGQWANSMYGEAYESVLLR
jgi:LmbE family N-acetylglucosaminyl deacetylase